VQDPLDTVADVESPEHVRFQHQVAGPARRALAYVVDLLIRIVVVAVLAVLLSMAGLAGGETLAGASQGVMLVVLFAVEWGYYVLFEVIFSGRTPGKMALRLRVVTDSGQPLGIVDSFLRNLLRAADFLPAVYALGVLVMGRDRRFRRLGDMVAGTMVVVEERHVVSSALRIEPPPSPAELAWLPSRLPLSGDELDAIELFLRRAGTLSPARELELAEMVAPVFARRMGLRFTNPQRFLQLIYHRARGAQAAASEASHGYRG
jgi:uncharacterized RDD family membrane protein YckC